MIKELYAMAPPPAANGQTPAAPGMSLMPLILIFFVFYILLIRPQKKQMQKHQEMLNSLTKGALVITSGGIHGRITSLKGKEIEVEIAPNTRVTINRSAIAGLVSPEAEIADDKGKNI